MFKRYVIEKEINGNLRVADTFESNTLKNAETLAEWFCELCFRSPRVEGAHYWVSSHIPEGIEFAEPTKQEQITEGV